MKITRPLVAASAAALAAGSLALFGGATASAAPTSQTFDFTGASQVFTVPASVCSVSVVALGAEGGNGVNSTATPGLGGQATATLTVTPGETLTVDVGGHGGDAEGFTPPGAGQAGGVNSAGGVGATAAGGVGGFNGGGDGGTGVSDGGGGGGGGMSSVLRGSTPLVVAGGGGGSGTETDVGVGGNGGGDGTDGGTPGSGPPEDPSGGQAGGAGGAAGVSVGDGITQPTAGTAGQGGTGGSSDAFQGGGGGGGGATGGGGGGASGSGTGSNSAGGGGGSGSGPSGTVFATGVQQGDGSVVINWDPAAGGCAAAVTPVAPAPVVQSAPKFTG